MAISGEDKTMKGFFDSLIRSAADLEVSQAVKAQGQEVLSTVQRHVSDVLGEVEEVFAFAKRSFQNIVNFFKGIFADISGFFKGVLGFGQIGFQKKSEDFYKDQIKNQEQTKKAVQGMVPGDTTEDFYSKSLNIQKETRDAIIASILEYDEETLFEEMIRVQKQTMEATDSLSKSFDSSFRQIIDDMDTANKISGEQLKQTKKGRLRELRTTKDKKGGGILGFFGNILKGAFSGLGGLIGKYIIPLLLVIGGIMGLSGLLDFKKIFGEGAGLREAIEAAVGGLIAGIFKLPAMAVDFLANKIFGIETNFADFFTTENIAKKIHGIVTWVDDNIVQPIRDFFASDTWQFIKDEWSNTLDAVGNMIEGIVSVFKDTVEFWTKKWEGLKELIFKQTEQEKAYEAKELKGQVPIETGLGEADFGLSYTPEEGKQIMDLGATAAERRANLAAQQEQRNSEARTQHAELLQKLDQVIAASEIYTPDSKVIQTTNLWKGGAGTNVPPGQEPKEQVAGVQGNSGLP